MAYYQTPYYGYYPQTQPIWKTIQCNNKLEKDYNYKMIKKEESLLANNIPYLFLFKKDFDDGTFKEKIRSLIE